MVRVNREQVDNYIQSGGLYFSLKKDKDSAVIRLPYKDLDELFVYDIVHNVSQDPKKPIWVDCLREDGDPLHKCPLCNEGIKTRAKLFIQVFNVADGIMQVWTRGTSMENQLEKDLRRLSKRQLSNAEIKVTRFGKEGDTETEYALDVADELDDITPEEVGELIDLYEAGVIIKCTAEEMEEFLDSGELPRKANKDKKSDEQEPRRRLTGRQEKEESDSRPGRGERSGRRLGRDNF